MQRETSYSSQWYTGMEEQAALNDRDRPIRPSKTMMNRLSASALAPILYLGFSLIYFGTSGHYAHKYLGNGNDPTVYIWCLNWWPWAIARGLNPFVSHHVWYPDGFNLTWANSVPSAALLVSPITWLTSSVVSFNILSLLAPALSAWMGFLLLRYLTKDASAAFVGGYLFGFSSYELGQLLGHLNLDLTFVVPLCVWLVIQRIKNDLSRLRFIAALAVALLVQLGFSTEMSKKCSRAGLSTYGQC